MTNFLLGDRVVHANEGKPAGSSGRIKLGKGHVLNIDYSGINSLGGDVFVARVKWSNGEEFTLDTDLLIRDGE